MNSPYMGKFRVSQPYKGSAHDGLDLVGVDSKLIHSTVQGTVIYAGWENPANHSQGFGQYVKIRKDGCDDVYYFGHLSEIRVKIGDTVRVCDVIGTEGHTGHCIPAGVGGNHCHYCVRVGGVRGQHRDISAVSGVPNCCGTYDDGYTAGTASADACQYSEPTTCVKSGSKGESVKWVQWQLCKAGYDCGAVDGICGKKTVSAILAFQQDNGLSVDGIVGKLTRQKMTA